MNWSSFDTWIVIIGILCSVACAIPGCFLVLRKMSMMGDAISHAVLPGLVIAFLITGSRASFPMFIGACIVGVVTTLFTQWITKFGNVDRGAAMGIVFTTLFSLGLLFIVQGANHVDLDPSCVLYGAIELAPLDTLEIKGIEIPKSIISLGSVMIINLLVMILLFKEFRISSFDSDLSDTLGISSQLMNYILMIMVSVTVVASFESVGSIIVISMLIVPPAIAYLLTDKLINMIIISCVVAVISAILGHVSSILIPSLFGLKANSTSGMISCVSGIIFLIVWILSSNNGFLYKLFKRKINYKT